MMMPEFTYHQSAGGREYALEQATPKHLLSCLLYMLQSSWYLDQNSSEPLLRGRRGGGRIIVERPPGSNPKNTRLAVDYAF